MIKSLIIFVLLASQGLPAEKETVVLGIYDNPPHTFLLDNREEGFIVDLWRDIALEMQLKLEFRRDSFASLLKALAEGEIDVLAPIAYNLERSRHMAYGTEAVLIDSTHVIVNTASGINDLQQLDRLSLAVVRGDHYAALLLEDWSKRDINCQVVEYDAFPQVAAAVARGEQDAGLIGKFSLQSILRDSPGLQISIMPGSFLHEPLFMAFSLKKSWLVDQVDSFLGRARSDETSALNRYRRKWFGQADESPWIRFLIQFKWLLIALVVFLVGLGLAFNLVLRFQVRRSTAEITRQKAFFEELFRNSPVAIAILDEKNCVLDLNREFERLFGYSLAESRGNDLDSLIQTEETATQGRVLREMAISGQKIDQEAQRKSKSGELVDVQIIGNPIILAERVVGIIAIYVDISERKRMMAEIGQMNRMESLSLLAGGIAHDFNNMLTAIVGNLSLARMQAGKVNFVEALQRSEKAALKAQGLTQQLMTFARGGQPQKKHLSMPDVLKDALALVLSGSNVRSELYLETSRVLCEVDGNQIMQVFNNILLNARQAMEKGGTIRIRFYEYLQESESTVLLPGTYLAVSFADEGPGIAPSDLEKLFTPYFTTKLKGTGLGMAISYAIVRKHQGTIRVESVPGQGAVFTVLLPVAEPVSQ